MHDINGKTLHIGDSIVWLGNAGSRYFAKITEVLAEDNVEKDGAKVAVTHAAPHIISHIRLIKSRAVKVRTMKELAALALNVQDACNLSGVAHSFSEIVTEIRMHLEAEGKGGTDNVNQHPICVLFINKLSSLSHAEDVSSFTHAYNWASEMTA